MGNNRFKLLIVEDEANIRSFVVTVLEANDYQVLTAMTCEQGRLLFASHNPDLIILDLGLPDRDGMTLISSVRSASATPILVLSARNTEADKVAALDIGANDYVTKPFGTGELLARVRALLRSSRYGAAMGAVPGGCFTAGALRIEYDRRQVTISGRDINLTQTEYNIVALLSQHAGKVMTYSVIIREIWGAADPGGVKKLQVNMANIRKKLGVRPGNPSYIQNELGVGYRMTQEDGE